MINILIIDDSSEKVGTIKEILISSHIKKENISIATSVNKAKKEIKVKYFDLIILDLQLPLSFGDSPSPGSGMRLLKEILSRDKFIIPGYVIGLTEFNESYKECISFFESNMFHLLRYSPVEAEWKNMLKNKLSYLVNLKNSILVNTKREFVFDIAIICALDKIELENILLLDANWEELKIANDPTKYYKGIFKFDNKSLSVVAASCCEMGMPASAALTSKLINHFTPRYLVMTGISAGIRGKVPMGSILVADPSYNCGSGKVTTENNKPVFIPTIRQQRVNQEIIENLKQLSTDNTFLNKLKHSFNGNKPVEELTIECGHSASGSAVLDNEQTLSEIKKHEGKLIGLEMEVYGVHLAASVSLRPLPKVFSLKSVCDFADGDKNDNYQNFSGYVSAQILFEYAKRYIDKS